MAESLAARPVMARAAKAFVCWFFIIPLGAYFLLDIPAWRKTSGWCTRCGVTVTCSETGMSIPPTGRLAWSLWSNQSVKPNAVSEFLDPQGACTHVLRIRVESDVSLLSGVEYCHPRQLDLHHLVRYPDFRQFLSRTADLDPDFRKEVVNALTGNSSAFNRIKTRYFEWINLAPSDTGK